MGNHYDPHYEDRMDRRRAHEEIGTKMLEAVNRIPADLLVDRVRDIVRRLVRIENQVIGGEAIDDLRLSRKEIEELFYASKS